MYKPSTYLEVAYFPTYLLISETYFLQNWLLRWNQILPQLRFIHNWVIADIAWMVRWWVLGQYGWEFAIWSSNTCFAFGIFQSIVRPKLKLVHTFQLNSTVRKSSSARSNDATKWARMHKCHNPSSPMKSGGWILLYFIADYAFSVVASTPELFIFTIACLFCNSQHRWERWILLLGIGW
jgi:hypothetical protein